jgi:hypothetical protein
VRQAVEECGHGGVVAEELAQSSIGAAQGEDGRGPLVAAMISSRRSSAAV